MINARITSASPRDGLHDWGPFLFGSQQLTCRQKYHRAGWPETNCPDYQTVAVSCVYAAGLMPHLGECAKVAR